jgi:MATE family multidrug resistance protein
VFLPTASDLRAMLRLALPVALVQLGIMAMGVVDTIMVGHVSPAALASGALGNLYFFIAGIFRSGYADGARPGDRASGRRARR